MKRTADYKGWRIGVTARPDGGHHRWTALLEVWEPGMPSGQTQGRVLTFAASADSEESIVVRGLKHAEDWIDKQEPRAPGDRRA